MAKKQSKVLTGLLTVAGTVGAFFGMRALVRWMQLRSGVGLGTFRPQQRMQMGETPASNLPSDRVPAGMREEGGYTPSRTEVGEDFQSVLEGERDETLVPATGVESAPVVDVPLTRDHARDHAREAYAENAVGAGRVETDAVEAEQPLPVASLVGPLIVHLLSFHNMVNMLEQRRETQATTATDVPDVRTSGEDMVSSLETQLPEFDRAALVRGSLQERIIQMMDRIHAALRDMDAGGDQVIRTRDELRPAVCKLLKMINKVEEDNVTGFEDVQKAYGCR